MSYPPSSLIIPTRNRPSLLLDTLESVLKGQHLPSEIIIVDQSDRANSGLASCAVLGGCPLRYIHSQGRGASQARNEGMQAAAYEILVLIDDDMQAPPEWYGTLVSAAYAAGPGAVVTGRVLPGQSELPGGFVPAVVDSPIPRIFAGRAPSDPLVSCHMALYHPVFLHTGGFDERIGPGTPFPAADDNDYSYRLLEAGYRIVYAPQAMLYHRAWRGARDFYPLRWNYGRGKGAFYTKFWSLRDSYLLKRMLKDILIRVVRFPWRVLHRPSLAIGDLIYAAGVISGSLDWLWRSARPQRTGTRSPVPAPGQPKGSLS